MLTKVRNRRGTCTSTDLHCTLDTAGEPLKGLAFSLKNQCNHKVIRENQTAPKSKPITEKEIKCFSPLLSYLSKMNLIRRNTKLPLRERERERRTQVSSCKPEREEEELQGLPGKPTIYRGKPEDEEWPTLWSSVGGRPGQLAMLLQLIPRAVSVWQVWAFGPTISINEPGFSCSQPTKNHQAVICLSN